MSRIHNFNAGPAALPLEVLETAQQDLVDYKGTGMSIMEASHRGKAYDAIHSEAIANLRELMGISDDYAVLLIQGGASQQFSMVPQNLLLPGETADYTNSGAWASKAIKEAKKVGNVNVVANCGKEIPTRVPSLDELKLTAGAKYLHITSNETISGAQWKAFPVAPAGTALVADMSSDILSRPLDVSKFGLIYAGAQKNLGPSGLTVVIIRKDLAAGAPENLATMLKYSTHIESDSLYNTPPCFSIYIFALVTRWVKKFGKEALFAQNIAKAADLYAAIDGSGGWYRGTAAKEFRSDMNVTWRLPSEELEAKFVSEAKKSGFEGLKGHRDVGGIRASIYNAVPPKAVADLVAFMADFQKANG
jgi:phosphoserine aminotransferase